MWNGYVDLKVVSLLLWLIVAEETRNGLVGCGFVRDMLALGEKLPPEVTLWSLEHGNRLHSSTNCSGF